ncbi:MAG: hypothetical protein H0X46_01295, partial [Bacteroidetes bacterium]|nr:hypothetical protein [Bacteroidota bacterium]
MIKKLLIFSFLVLPILASAQYKPNRQARKRSRTSTGSSFNKRKKPRPEFIIGMGASNFLGELGG